ncbi:MAG: pentapeptide repeat-containing protein [Proteobacteria bacterium]|nr:pentapeptide repeat-containing protein [Pseudomonadota bacterium]
MAMIKRILSLIPPFYWGLFASVLALALGGGLFYFAYHTQFMLENGLQWRDVFFVIFGAIGIGLAVWRSKGADEQIELTKKTLEENRVQAIQSRDQARISLLQDRYQAATNMLSSDTMAARMGGIHALKGIAETESKEYHIQIMELLAVFIRHPMGGIASNAPSPSDVRAAMMAIAYRNDSQKEREEEERQKNKDWRIDLTGAYLRQLPMPEADLSRVCLSSADMRYVNLENANLSHANLSRAKLWDAGLSDANLTKTNLSHARGITQEELDKAFFPLSVDENWIRRGDPPILTGAKCGKTAKPLTCKTMQQIET